MIILAGRMTRDTIGGSLQEGLQDAASVGNTNGFKINVNSVLQISSSQRGLLSDESHHIRKQKMLTSIANIFKLQRLTLTPHANSASPSAKLRKKTEERYEFSHFVPSSIRENLRKPFNCFFAKKIDWPSLRRSCKQWIKNPLNMAILLWITCVAVSGAILFLVMTGMLNKILNKQSQRNSWFEVNNQFLNALFTLMCLYQHPKRFHHLVLLCRWKPKDIIILRKLYCKNGTCKPHEWFHMMVVVVLLHVNCFAQYALCGLNWGFNRSERPVVGVGICISIAIAAPALAGVYCIASPLGKEYETEEAAQNHIPTSNTFASRNDHSLVEYTPQWRGGLFDLWDNLSVACLTLFCSFCVFGRNMERQNFGNKYVHIATFLLFCVAPFWIFNMATINIDDEPVRLVLGLLGIFLCVFGLLYGGYWRIQMRERFNLPPNKLCCGKPAVTDCIQWLFCCWCSLAQEVRTAESYDIVEDKFFCKKQTQSCVQLALNSLPPEDKAPQVTSMSTSSFWSSHSFNKIWSEESKDHSSLSEIEFSRERKQNVMEVPIPLTIQIDDNDIK
ncbi:hypothetical protein GLYMA_03G041200v4 [Glycine max]|uniref:PLAC8 family protein n=1 Tax=Glycine max TaxID=3847 RepID=K7KCR4_SOYBN|nr:uncharacterized protein LOC100799892 [Glycine max]XP_006576457.1 uncharacterized protein LOC100799892 [Glycine max]KAG4393210.1 hypothetical protein GLYMA_03G041200v4 [Glycine max]KRH65507.1 hypothetical protein GLYMA_03G041200v4 [Glycine max]|eukprot:XP_003522015.2 uncharacterized protein LOC100799892 [Glycine max]